MDGNLVLNLDKNGKPSNEPLSEVLNKLVLVDAMTAKMLNAERHILRLHVQEYVPGAPAQLIPDWNPRRPVGIWFSNGTVSIRNVSILPKPIRQA